MNSIVNSVTLLGYNPLLVAFWKAMFWGFDPKVVEHFWEGWGAHDASQTFHGMGGHPRGFLPLLVAFGWKISKGFLVFSSALYPFLPTINRGVESYPFHSLSLKHMPCNDLAFYLPPYEIVSYAERLSSL